MTELEKWQSMRTHTKVVDGAVKSVASVTPTLREYAAAANALMLAENDSIGMKENLGFVRMHCKEIIESFGKDDAQKIVAWCGTPTGSGLWGAVRSILEVEIATKEKASTVPLPLEDGLHQDGRVLIWGGKSYTLKTNQSTVFSLLVEAYINGSNSVPLQSILDRLGGNSELRDSFRSLNKETKKKVHDPCWYLIIEESNDMRRMADPKAK